MITIDKLETTQVGFTMLQAAALMFFSVGAMAFLKYFIKK